MKVLNPLLKYNGVPKRAHGAFQLARTRAANLTMPSGALKRMPQGAQSRLAIFDERSGLDRVLKHETPN